MKTIKKNVYYCDFCKKRGLASGAMKKHEERCTMNPNRICGVCKMLEETQAPIEKLKAAVPDVSAFVVESDMLSLSGDASAALNAALPGLARVANDCPACIMAAYRQSKVPVKLVTDFNFTEWMDGIWSDINEARRENDGYNVGY
jgi:hypothetical protein